MRRTLLICCVVLLRAISLQLPARLMELEGFLPLGSSSVSASLLVAAGFCASLLLHVVY